MLPEILDPAVVLLLEGISQDALEAGVGLAGHGPVVELVRVGLVGEEPHPLAVLCQVEGHLQSEGGLAGGGVSADDHHVPGAGVELLVQIRKAQLEEVGGLAAVPALEEGPESLTIHPSSLHGIRIDASDCPDLVPILSVAAALAKGTTEIIHAERLRLKECDRLKAMASELTKMGAHIEERPDGLIIRGVPMLHGAGADSWNDHRVAMSLAIAATRSDGPVILKGSESVQKSYPQFWQDYESLGGKIK